MATAHVTDPSSVELGSVTSVAETGMGKKLATKAPKSKKRIALEGGSLVIMWIFSALCLGLGIAIFVVPATWLSRQVGQADYVNNTCPAVLPELSPYTPVPVTGPSGRQPFIDAWDAYVLQVSSRPEGVRDGCMPLRFPATAAYRGVAVIHHGFSSCPQEMTTLAAPLAAAGYDAVFPLLPGHGNGIVFTEDAPNFLWSFLGIAFSLMGLLVMCCSRICPFANCCKCPCCDDSNKGIGCCGHRKRTLCIYSIAVLLGILLLVSSVGFIIVLAGGADFCLSLSFVDGVGPGCGGMSEYNDNLPKESSGYTDFLDSFDQDVASLAVGELVLAGLSGGGGAAGYSSMKTRADGSALYKRTILYAPYIDVATIGTALGPAKALGLGELKIDFGNDCRIARRGAGKAGYCNYRLNRIDAMRDVGQLVLDTLSVPPDAIIEVVKVENDPTVTNADITTLATKMASLSSSTSLCVATHVDSIHSPLSIWNYIHQDVEMEWIPELVCQTVAFLADGTPMPTDGVTTDGLAEPVCDTDCDLGGCSYDCQADHFFTCTSSGRVRRRK